MTTSRFVQGFDDFDDADCGCESCTTPWGSAVPVASGYRAGDVPKPLRREHLSALTMALMYLVARHAGISHWQVDPWDCDARHP